MIRQPRVSVAARLKPDVKDAIAEVAKAQKKTASQVIERALIAWLAMQQQEQKAA